MRVVKDPIERKKEIIDAAAQLFMTKGYEDTSVNLIVEHLGIAKGTIYHYFKSKEDILEAVLEHYMDSFAAGIQTAVNSQPSNAFDKMMFVLKSIILNNKGPEHLTNQIEDNKNARLHHAMDEKFHEKFYPIIVAIIEQGVQEGIFDVKHPQEITQILLYGVRSYMHVHIPHFHEPGYAVRKMQALEELFNKVLLSNSDKYVMKLLQ